MAALVGRMPLSMFGITLVLLVEQQRGSYAVAGAASAAGALGLAVLSPWVARLVDRRGQRRVLPVALVIAVIGTGLLPVVAQPAVPLPVLLLTAAVTGGALPPLGPAVRARWVHVLNTAGQTQRIPVAFAWESVADEVVFVAGPLLAVLLATAVAPSVALLAGLLLCAVGTLVFTATADAPTPAPDARGGLGVIRSGGLQALSAATLCIGVVFGGFEVGTLAVARGSDADAAAGVLLAVFAAASAVTGLLYGARRWRSPLHRRYVICLLLLSAGSLALAAAPTLLTLGAAAVVAGAAAAPALISGFGLAERLVPAANRTEGFTWITASLGAGIALGTGLAGWLADDTPRAALLLCLAGSLSAAGIAAAARHVLRPRP